MRARCMSCGKERYVFLHRFCCPRDEAAQAHIVSLSCDTDYDPETDPIAAPIRERYGHEAVCCIGCMPKLMIHEAAEIAGCLVDASEEVRQREPKRGLKLTDLPMVPEGHA